MKLAWRRAAGFVLMLLFGSPAVVSGLDKGKAAYVGGTIAEFNASEVPVEGTLDTNDDRRLVFTAETEPFAGHSLPIEYGRIQDLEFGQKTGRRVGRAIGTSVVLGPFGLLSLSAKKRRHYFTVAYVDERGQDQVAVLELGKDIARATLAVVEARSGLPVEYRDDEARKWAH